MMKKKLLYGMLSLSVVLAMCGCGKGKPSPDDTGKKLSISSAGLEDEEVSEDADTGQEQEEEEGEEQEQVAESTDSGSDIVAKFECEEMDFSIQISNDMKETMEKLKYEYHPEAENELLQTSCDSCDFYIMYDRTKQIMFTIYRLPQEYTIEDLQKLDANLQIVGYTSENLTYLVQLPTEPEEELTVEQKEEVVSMIDDKLHNISPFILLED